MTYGPQNGKPGTQQQDRANRLAHQGDGQAQRGDKGGTYAYTRTGVVLPEPDCSQRSCSHPNSILIAVFEKAERSKADIAFSPVSPERVKLIDPAIQLWP